MITKERLDKERLLMRCGIFPEFLQGKFPEKDWKSFTQSIGIGEPEEQYTEEDKQRDIEIANRAVEKVSRTRYERVV